LIFPNSHELPPFISTGRAQDYVFGVLLATAYQNRLIAYSPLTLQHTRPVSHTAQVPSFVDRMCDAVTLSNLLLHARVSATTTDRVAKVGYHLKDIATSPQRDFVSILHEQAYRGLQTDVSLFQARISDHSWTSPDWKNAMTEVIKQSQNVVSTLDSLDISDFTTLQSQYKLYANVLIHWKHIWNQAQVLNLDFLHNQ
jgi:hypothetical protein